ncbi:MAG: hypothetical protein JST80_13455 [Bdellovibrionales bacterium]|nr:hypothetical protein [Bdellovibrionales bacterium]
MNHLRNQNAHAKSLTTIGIAVVVILGSLVAASCARKNTDPPTVQGYGMDQSYGAKLVNSHGRTTAAAKKSEKLLKLILVDKKVLSFIAAYQKKNGVTCTQLSAGQINWNCKTETQCAFSLESTCVTDVTTETENDQIVRLSMLGEGDSVKMTYKMSDPTATAAESKVVRVKFEY